MINLTLYLYFVAISYVITHFQPLQRAIELLTGQNTGLIAGSFKTLLSCSQCFGLWFTGLFLYFGMHWNFTFELIGNACIVSASTLIVSLIVNRLTF